MAAYYNEHDPPTAAWLRELIREGLIADGDVDERSIVEVTADDVRGFVQCHWFGGIGGWSYALRLAGWPDTRKVWTGSCPCQPFSSAGKGDGEADPRDLWPAWFRLIRECRPDIVFGEQVEAAARSGWFDRLSADLEGEGYAVGACVLGAHSVGAFHIRQRLWFVADAGRQRRQQDAGRASADEAANRGAGRHGSAAHGDHVPTGDGEDGRLADAEGRGLGIDGRASGIAGYVDECVPAHLVGNAERRRLESRHEREDESTSRFVETGSFWSDCDWLPCRDGKWRPTQSGLFPLASRIPGRVGLLRGAGNSIVPQVAAAFIEAYCNAQEARVRA